MRLFVRLFTLHISLMRSERPPVATPTSPYPVMRCATDIRLRGQTHRHTHTHTHSNLQSCKVCSYIYIYTLCDLCLCLCVFMILQTQPHSFWLHKRWLMCNSPYRSMTGSILWPRTQILSSQTSPEREREREREVKDVTSTDLQITVMFADSLYVHVID